MVLQDSLSTGLFKYLFSCIKSIFCGVLFSPDSPCLGS